VYYNCSTWWPTASFVQHITSVTLLALHFFSNVEYSFSTSHVSLNYSDLYLTRKLSTLLTRTQVSLSPGFRTRVLHLGSAIVWNRRYFECFGFPVSVIIPPLHHTPLVLGGWDTFGVAVSKRPSLTPSYKRQIPTHNLSLSLCIRNCVHKLCILDQFAHYHFPLQSTYNLYSNDNFVCLLDLPQDSFFDKVCNVCVLQ
jgi:hypothetical protein